MDRVYHVRMQIVSTRLLMGILSSTFTALFADADVTWFNTSTNIVADSSGSTPVVSSGSDGKVGGFAQLIDLGANGVFNPAIDSGTGVTGDDNVVAVSWIGRATFGIGFIGSANPAFIADQPNTTYGVRIWNTNSPVFMTNDTSTPIPLGSAVFYGDSPITLTTDSDPDVPAIPVSYNFAGGGPVGFSTLSRAGADTDGDSLPDWWELLHFGHITDNGAAGDDDDIDGLTHLQEFLAGTQPTNAMSVLEVESLSRTNNSVILRWSSESNRIYTLNRSTNLLNDFDDLATNQAATPPLNLYTDVLFGITNVFYRIDLE